MESVSMAELSKFPFEINLDIYYETSKLKNRWFND